MPLYEFRCLACDHEFEELVSYDRASAGLDCPACGAARALKKLSLFSAGVSSSDPVCGQGACGLPECADAPASSPFT